MHCIGRQIIDETLAKLADTKTGFALFRPMACCIRELCEREYTTFPCVPEYA